MAARAGHEKARRWIAGGAVALVLLAAPAAAGAATSSNHHAHAATKTATSILHTAVPARGKYFLTVFVRARGKHARTVDIYIAGQKMRTVVANPWWGAAVYYTLNISSSKLVVRTVNAPPAVQVHARLSLRKANTTAPTKPVTNSTPPATTTTTTTPTTTTTTTSPPPPPTPDPITSTYTTPIFSDDFQADYGAAGSTFPNSSLPGQAGSAWSLDGWGGCGTSTLSQNNTGSASGINASQNAYLTPNGLAITAVRTSSGNYVSAQVDSYRPNSTHGFSAEYGMVEASIEMPGAQGLCPGFWMLGDNNMAGGSSSPGEIDVVEAPTFGGGLGSPAFFDLHGYSTAQIYNTSTYAVDLSSGFHTYAIVWTPTSISWLIDGTVYASATQASLVAGASWANAFSYGNFHLILDLAVGGWPCDAGACGPQSAPQPSYTMYVKWVKWFQQP
jgi:beta-glucanase (GH16 family)